MLVTAGVLVFCVSLYRKDTRDLPRPAAAALLTLRILTLLGLLVFFLGPEKRSEARIVKPSRLAVLMDTSLSMGLSDATGPTAGQRRADAVLQVMRDSPLLQELNQQHELAIYRFGETTRPESLLTIPKQGPLATNVPSQAASGRTMLSTARAAGIAGQAGLLLAALLLLLTWFLKRNASPTGSWTMASGSLLLAGAVLLLALADLLVSQFPLTVSLGWQTPGVSPVEPAADFRTPEPAERGPGLQEIDWADWLAPRGVATRLGTAVHEVVNNSRGTALAGILLVSDGRDNQGTPPSRAVAAASEANIPLYIIGVGSDQPARNVRISELEAPARVFPDDRFQIQAMLQSWGLQGTSVRVRLSSVDEQQPQTPVTEDERSIALLADGQPVPVRFEIAQQEGRRRYFVEVVAPADDVDVSDNVRSVTVQALVRKSRVLLIAGGPSRDYRFLRNQLYRDENVQLDVWLQLAEPGADQESDNLLFDFPETLEELDVYDCIVAFDPDWRLLSLSQTRHLERWVSRNAGGLLVVAGPVFTPEWTRRPRGDEAMDLIRGLYPVSFYSQGSATLKLGRFGGAQPFPLEFSRAGRSARHLWLGGDDASQNLANWDSFEGVYGYYAVNEAKAGAEVLARFSDETTAIDGQLPIYLASQFYGAGRVFFQASGEIWRLRTVDVGYFQSYYDNLIRWVSEGRLLRDSSRGVLLLDRNRCWVGDQLVVRAILRNAADQPLLDRQVNAAVRRPDGTSQTLELVNIQDAARPGSFTGQFVASLEGDYEVSLPLPDASDGKSLRGGVRASIPDLEKVQPERNDALLQEMARRTSGLYLYDLSPDGQVTWQENDSETGDAVRERRGSLTGAGGISQRIGVVDQETFLPGSPDELFTRKFSRWLLLWLTLVLCTEWVVRRLHKLA
jgi:hypothetical protein